MKTIQIYFEDGPILQLTVSAQILASMLVLRPDHTGISFRQQMQFAVVDGGERRMMSSSRIVVLEEA